MHHASWSPARALQLEERNRHTKAALREARSTVEALVEQSKEQYRLEARLKLEEARHMETKRELSSLQQSSSA